MAGFVKLELMQQMLRDGGAFCGGDIALRRAGDKHAFHGSAKKKKSPATPLIFGQQCKEGDAVINHAGKTHRRFSIKQQKKLIWRAVAPCALYQRLQGGVGQCMLCNFMAERQRIVRAVFQPNAVGQRCFAVSNEAIPRQRKLPRLPNRRTAELDLNIVAERLIAAVDV